ncbi:hypothetical protein QYM36_002473 [Artemia franciscana]|uniref:Uncharacterized protein n=1 Tax=Artemia franciscana TaxID=6661 RepID=A0AA88LEL7_ARTSF|nr:hypothetical protein QYM36_002473 [Artemia franciscana]
MTNRQRTNSILTSEIYDHACFERESEEELEEKDLLSELIMEELAYGVSQLNPNSQLIVPEGMADYIADSIFKMAQYEPCGIKGCVIYFNLDSGRNSDKQHELAKIRCDDYTVAMFEVHVTLHREASRWLKIVPQIFKSLKGSATPIVINKNYTISLKKLFRN